MSQNLFEDNGAEFSDDLQHRYRLWRIWDKSQPLVMFIGLNPSKADSNKDDPTIRRVKRFARDNGFGGFYMCNLFTYISTDPDNLKGFIYCTNNADLILLRTATMCDAIVFAWGGFKIAEERSRRVKEFFPEAFCLGRNSNGFPSHPLYLPADQPLIKFLPQE